MRVHNHILSYCFSITLLFLFSSIAYCQQRLNRHNLADMLGKEFVCKDENGNRIYFQTISDSAVIVASSSSARKAHSKIVRVKIPEFVNYREKQYEVIGIDNYAFNPPLKGNYPNFKHKPSKLREIILPNTLTFIGESAFSDCQLLKSIVIPNSVKEIWNTAFLECESLDSIVIPSSVDSIEEFTFRGCKSLTHIVLPPNLKKIGDYAFSKSGLQEIDLPPFLETIGTAAFFETSLRSIYIPPYVKYIGECAFAKNPNLNSVRGLHSGIKLGETVFDGLYVLRFLNTFEYYANSFIIPQIVEWRKKGEFETREMYAKRVTKENQDIEIQRLTALAIKKYVAKNKYKPYMYRDSYDADNQTFEIHSNYGTSYVKVPISEAPSFKNNFESAKFDTQYEIVGNHLQVSDLTITIGTKQYVADKNASLTNIGPSSIDIDLPQLDISSNLGTKNNQRNTDNFPRDNNVDKNIPNNSKDNTLCFAIIIGNQQYQRVSDVTCANNDARIFAEYCLKTLGLPETNVKVYENASYGTMIGAMSDLQKIAKAFKGNINVIFYYAGHGIPNETTKDSYLLPIDADGMNTEVCYPLNRLYKELGELNAKQVIVFMDACFSGAERGDGMVVASRGVTIKPKSSHPMGNTIVFSAATGQQAAYPYKEKGHGIFTYYLLKKLQETKGDVTLGDLGEYICDEAAKQAILTNGKEQTPVVLTPIGMSDEWKNWTLR